MVGYIKYFHPSNEATSINWDKYTVDGIKKVEQAENTNELLKVLNEIFNPIAPTVKISPLAEKEKFLNEIVRVRSKSSKIIYWKHRGYTQDSDKGPKDLYPTFKSKIKKTKWFSEKNIPNPQNSYFADLENGIACLVPIALYANSKGTLPYTNNQNLKNYEKPEENFSTNNRSVRLTAIALCWNIFQHFHPYYDLFDYDWKQVLKESLRESSANKDSVGFYKTLKRMIAKTRDGHASAYLTLSTIFKPPLFVDWVENKLIVTEVDSTIKDKIHRGDIVLKIDGQSAEKVIEETKMQISGSEQFKMTAAPHWILFGEEDTNIDFLIQDSLGEKNVFYKRTIKLTDYPRETRPPNVCEIKPEIYYVNIGKVSKEEYKESLEKLKSAKGIIFYARNYMTIGGDNFLQHIVPATKTHNWIFTPILKYPDHNNVEYTSKWMKWTLKMKKPFLNAKKVFIVDGVAISWTETFMGIVEYYKLGEIVGEPTGGTNGGPNSFKLIGGYEVRYTGMKATKFDGSQHFGIGIQPTIPAQRTIQGVKEGKDELLDKAIEYLETQK